MVQYELEVMTFTCVTQHSKNGSFFDTFDLDLWHAIHAGTNEDKTK